MFKITSLTLLIALTTTVFAGAQTPARPGLQDAMKKHHIAANGRCDGVSYGTGARSCGTATGGPVGGISSRN